MELKNALAVCLISMFSATLVVLIARALDLQAASELKPELAKIARELETIREQVSGGVSLQGGSGAAVQAEVQDGVKAYYVHSNTRCKTCETIESLADSAIHSGFQKQLDSGQMSWELFNYETSSGAHFVTEYGVQMPTVVLVQVVDGKTVDWRRLDRVWGLFDDPTGFTDYVQGEIREILDASVKASKDSQPVVEVPVVDTPTIEYPASPIMPDNSGAMPQAMPPLPDMPLP